MTQENKELLLKDLCARLPYGVKVQHQHQEYLNEVQTIEIISKKYGEIETESVLGFVDDFKPYLFPLSSMTEEQREELYKIGWYLDGDKIYSLFRNYDDTNYITHIDCFELVNWCYKNNFDINGLIPKDLAIDATGKNIY